MIQSQDTSLSGNSPISFSGIFHCTNRSSFLRSTEAAISKHGHINTMDNLILEAIQYISKISKKKVTEDSISTYLSNKGVHNIDNKSIIEILKQLQGKGLINQLYRPIDTAVTSKGPHPTTSQSVISSIAENHVHDTSDNDIVTSINDIINKTIPSINTSLPATPMAGINTTPRVLTKGNSSLNAKFESLESKLHGEIIAIKLYFTDELRSLKNETTINKEQVYNINNEETTILKNKIKLLELENKLLKDDITNKQKFIDTLLQHNSKLSQNFDISSIISTAKEARKQPHEKQHYEKNDTGLNNRQKQEENKSSEKSNEKNVSNKEKNRSSEKDSLPTDKSNKNIHILGDSMVKHVEGWKLNKFFLDG